MTPSVSICVPVFGPHVNRLTASVASLRAQSAPDWEACIVTDRADLPAARAALGEEPDRRVVLRERSEPRDWATALAPALGAATGELVTWVDPGDELHPDAIERVLVAFDDDVDFLYSDEDEIDERGRLSNPRLKPDWSPERLHCQLYTGRLAVVRRSLLDSVGGIRTDRGDAAEHDLVLRVTERARRVAHVTDALYHRARRADSREAVSDAGLGVVDDHLRRVGFPAVAQRQPGRPDLCLLRPRLRDHPLVSIVIPTAGTRRIVHGRQLDLVVNCVASIVGASTYPSYEIVCVVDEPFDETVRQSLVEAGGERLRLVSYTEAFNFARKINVGALHARGEHLLLLNDDTEVITPDWMESMLMFAQQHDVGAVGAKLLFADRRLQHVGVIALGGTAGHPYYGWPEDFDGHGDNTRVPCNYLAVTAACLLTRRECFEQVGGLSPTFPRNYNDLDYCFKLHHAGYRIVFDPFAELFHFEWSSRIEGSVEEAELQALRGRWGSLLRSDPYYNPNFGLLSDFLVPVNG